MNYSKDGRNLSKDEIKRQKREEAESRQTVHNSLTKDERVAKLDKKFGAGKGAKKERDKLNV
jgi:hypothetical protein